MIRAALCLAAISFAGVAGLAAQSPQPSPGPTPSPTPRGPRTMGPVTNIGDYYSEADLMALVPQVLEKAKAAKDGLGAITIKRYPGNMINMNARTMTGVGEMHANWSDVLISLDGEADVITGGTLVDRTDGPDGESRGSRSEGGVHHIMHKGDMIHIAPSTPHWTVLKPGTTWTFLAFKIANPPAAPAPAQ